MFRRRQPADADAFGAEVLRYLESLYATALRLTRNRADAEDLVQDTLVKAFRCSDKFEPGTNLRAWLSTILHNTWRNRVRDEGREAVDAEALHQVGVLSLVDDQDTERAVVPTPLQHLGEESLHAAALP